MQGTADMIRQIPHFKGLPEQTLNRLEGATRARNLAEGEIYTAAGKVHKAFCVVLAGQLKFYRVNRAGKEQVFGFAGPNDVFGLTSLTDPYRPTVVACMARIASEILEIDLRVVREEMHRDPALAVAILKEQSRRYSSMLDLVDQLALHDAHNRLARWLDRWIEDNHPEAADHDTLIVLPYTQAEIAAQIGTMREVVSRGFSRMEKDGIIRSAGKRVRILSRERLRHMGAI
jgi:CRP-like cAMP-binding protein